MSKELKEAGVEVLLNTNATVDTVEKYNPMAVFLAGGAEPICPPLPGLDSDNVIMSSDILIGAK